MKYSALSKTQYYTIFSGKSLQLSEYTAHS